MTKRCPNFSIPPSSDEDKSDRDDSLARWTKRIFHWEPPFGKKSMSIGDEELHQDGLKAERLKAAINRLRRIVNPRED